MLLQNLLNRSRDAGPSKVQSGPSRVYLDFNSTTPLAPEILPGLMEIIQNSTEYGNPSSIHASGRPAKQVLRESRAAFAQGVGCHPLEVIFCSGATEASNTVFQAVARSFLTGATDRNEILVSAVEHPSVLKAAQALSDLGLKVFVIPVFADGELDLDYLKTHLTAKTALVSVMAANNETGIRFPIAEVARLARAHGALVHSDMVQILGKEPIDLSAHDLDYASFSAHKFYALKGTGVLYVRKTSKLTPLLYGGAQERSRRGGTENILGIASLGLMCLRASLVPQMSAGLQELRDYLERRILAEISEVQIVGQKSSRIANTSMMTISGVDGETLLMSLDLRGIAVSTGAACSSGNPEPSPVLLAMGLSRKEAQSSLRISLGWTSRREEVDYFIQQLKEIVARLRALNEEKSSLLGVSV